MPLKKNDSYSLTPNSPEPKIDWRDSNNQSKTMKPLVDGVKPPKMPKKRKDGIVKWLKTITGIEVEESKSKKPNKKFKRKNFKNKPISNKKFNKNAIKPTNKNNPKTKKSSSKNNNLNKKTFEKKSNTKIDKRKDNKVDANKNNEKSIKKSPIKEIVKEKKVKKDIPQRAKNDPRQKD